MRSGLTSPFRTTLTLGDVDTHSDGTRSDASAVGRELKFSPGPNSCWSCGSAVEAGFDARPTFGDGTFSYLRCVSCGLAGLALEQGQRDFRNFYAADYKPGSPEFAEGKRSLLASFRELNFSRMGQRIEKLIPPGRLLDVGCGAGLFLSTMRRRGWDVAGLEPNEGLVGELQSRHGLDARQGWLDDVDPSWGPFDAVTMCDVIEHLPNPLAALVTVKSLLRPGGVLLITTPNVDALEHEMFGEFWYALQPPEHLWLFSLRSAECSLRRAGFEGIKPATSPVSYAWPSISSRVGIPPGGGVVEALMKLAVGLPVGLIAERRRAPAQIELYAQASREEMR